MQVILNIDNTYYELESCEACTVMQILEGKARERNWTDDSYKPREAKITITLIDKPQKAEVQNGNPECEGCNCSESAD